MSVGTLLQPAAKPSRRRPAVVKRRGAAAVPSAYDEMSEAELYVLLDERLDDLSRRASAGLSRAEERLKRSV